MNCSTINTATKEVLKQINNLRNTRNIKPLVENSYLTFLATEWACECIRKGEYKHANIRNVGDLVGGYKGKEKCIVIIGERIISEWTKEEKNFTNVFPFPDVKINEEKEVKHFTQLTWEESEEIGIGVANRLDVFYFVFLFFPEGNIKDKYVHKRFLDYESV